MAEKHTIKFYPVGNGDTTQIATKKGKRILIDFNHKEDNPFDIAKDIKKDLGDEKSVDILVISHMHQDHVGGFEEFFYLEHSKQHQDKERVKIKELWIPAAVILEKDGESLTEDQYKLRSEARYRIRKYAENPVSNPRNIRVFSCPKDLESWLKKEEIDRNTVAPVFVKAGKKIAEDTYGVEIFCHTPFADDTDEDDIKENECSIILHLTFNPSSNNKVKYFAIGDAEYHNIERMVLASKENEDRLEWDIFAVPHHCSYKALSEEKGKVTTVPNEQVEKLLMKGREGSYMIASCKPVSKEDEVQPPHFQAKSCYEGYLEKINGTDFMVTMEHPDEKSPKPIIFEISDDGFDLKNKDAESFSINPSQTVKTTPTRYA